MAVPVRASHRGARWLPSSVSGWIALVLFGLSILLLLGRLVLTPPFGVPLNFLIVFVAMGVSGLVAVVSVAFRHERSVGVFVTLVLGLMAAAFVVAEALGGSGTNPALALGEGDNGKTVTVSQETAILLQLPGNPTTGYDWEVTIGDPSVLEQDRSKFTPSSSALGAGGTYYFWFHSKAAGKTELTLVYRRAWETGVEPLKTYRVTITVQ